MNNQAMFEEIVTVLSNIPIDFGGGCSVRKASVMAWIIKEYGFLSSLDIGVYRGRSLFPQAIAHKHASGGVVYGVDPWSKFEASEDDNLELKAKIDEFVKTTDFDELFRSVNSLNNELSLTKNCVIVRDTSANARHYFDNNKIKFDLIHVDGNHDTVRVMEDLDLYLPKLNQGGVIVLDDISWDSVKPAYNRLNSKMKLLYKKLDNINGDDFAVFCKDRPFYKLIIDKYNINNAVKNI